MKINKDLDLARASFKSATEKHPDSKMAWIVWFLLVINHGGRVSSLQMMKHPDATLTTFWCGAQMEIT